MDFDAFLEIINTYPALYFIAGLVVGYFLHGIVANGFLSLSSNKKTSRYQSQKSDAAAKRPTTITELQEPSFDLPEAVVKTLTPRRISSIAFDQHGNEV
jgi:hypothetical protein